jgi:hypothetical protein
MKASTKGKGKAREVRFDPIFFAASVPARKPTAKDLKDVEEHNTMDDTVEDLPKLAEFARSQGIKK